MDTVVLVVGAGPTGLMLANQLGRRGVRALIIDRHSGPAQQTRAMAVQARTLEIYASLGVAEEAVALGKRTAGANIWAAGRHTARIPVGEIGKGLSAFPYILMLGQDDNERLLGDKLGEWNVAVQWNTELIGLEQHPDHVVATLRQPDGMTRTITVTWVAGCDGAKSAVREFCGIGFPGAPYEHVFFVADTVATGNMVPDELNVYLQKEGFHLFFPMRGLDRWRVIGILPEPLRERDKLAFDEVIPSLQNDAGAGLSFSACHWFSTYRIHHRRATRFRDRRCFLLGDAAHVHSPMGGQGMNTGLQDAYNLGWKLALVVSGQADPELLDSYEAERIPVAEKLLATTDRAFMLVVKDNWMAGLFRTRIMGRLAAFAMRLERVRKLAFGTISELGIQYRDGPLAQTEAGLAAGAPRGGDRFPWMELKFSADGPAEDLFTKLDDTRFNLILVGQPSAPAVSLSPAAGAAAGAGARAGVGVAAAAAAETAAAILVPVPGPDSRNWLRTHAISAEPANERELARAGIIGPAYFLLRPDGHIGLAGTTYDAAAVRKYLADCHLHPAGAFVWSMQP